jgi:DNA-binding CsgD family transcriptional regulator/HD-like signal output (HDOD) protein
VAGRGGARLAAAFDAVATFPVLAEARLRALRLAKRSRPAPDELAAVVESDLGMTVLVLGAANRPRGKTAVGGVPAAISRLRPAGVARVIEAASSYDFLDPGGPWGTVPEAMRRHAVATRIACERIAELAELPARDELAAAALLHDFGQLVLICLYGDFERLALQSEISPDERAGIERRELGIDHAIVGGVLARRIGLPATVAAAIERHHAPDAEGPAATVALADLVARHAHGEPVTASRCGPRAKALGLSPAQLRGLLYEYPYAGRKRRRSSEPCPLSERELDALRGLASGRRYKEIAEEMGLSASTVRTHLHNVYGKIGASDRAQAVLVATDQGWI